MGGKAQRRLMKEGLGRPAVMRLARSLERSEPSFDRQSFVDEACEGLEALELKARVDAVAQVLRRHLPRDFALAALVLRRLVSTWESGEASDPLRGFAAWPLFRYVELAGRAHFELSLPLLGEMTHLFSAEFAVRPFLADRPDEAFETLHRWAQEPREELRRLASECCRPRLPWAEQLPFLREEPERIVALLERLVDDDSAFVRRSVANNLADIAKDHPELVVEHCRRWQDTPSEGRRWIIRRATRNLVKEGHPAVWPLLGYTESPRIGVDRFTLSSASLRLGETLVLDIDLRSSSRSSQKLEVDYAIHFVKASGKTAAKVFKLKSLELEPGRSIRLLKSHPLRPATTRAYYPGVHRVELLVNGKAVAEASFTLLCEPGSRAAVGTRH